MECFTIRNTDATVWIAPEHVVAILTPDDRLGAIVMLSNGAVITVDESVPRTKQILQGG
jgi:hypothetical protein